MPWYSYVLLFLSGMLLPNGVPHFVKGISGEPFPTPFASPPGVGESSPFVNVLWGLGNFLCGALLLHFFWPSGPRAAAGWGTFVAGVFALSVPMASYFAHVRVHRGGAPPAIASDHT